MNLTIYKRSELKILRRTQVISASQLDVVKRYIKNQDKHHKRKTFAEEYDEWKRQYGIYDDQ